MTGNVMVNKIISKINNLLYLLYTVLYKKE